MHAVFVCLSLTVCVIMCVLSDGMDFCMRVCLFVFMREQETTNNTMLTKIQSCAFVKVTPIHLAWLQSLYLFSHSRSSFLPHHCTFWLRCKCVSGTRRLGKQCCGRLLRYVVFYVCSDEAVEHGVVRGYLCFRWKTPHVVLNTRINLQFPLILGKYLF